MIPALTGLGVLAWVSIGYVAIRRRSPALIGLAIAFLLGAVAAVVWTGNVPDEDTTVGGFLILLWAAGALAAFLLNPSYLRWRWEHNDHHVCTTPPPPSARPAGAQFAGQVPILGMPVIQDVVRPHQMPHQRPTDAS